ncbi:MAG: L,D-transpeptidase family protein, partial [Atopobiaceae bacterium]|nr:L,D-transpeptidase family protein [Atopobiaceae bacterium]
GTEYEFLVQAHCMGRWSAFTEADLVAATPWDPSSPVVRVASTGDGTVTLEWDGVDGAERYAVAERVGGRYVTFSYDCEGTSYTASDLANGYEHSFLVQAYVGGRWSSVSPDLRVSAVPEGTEKPCNYSATPTDRGVRLSWDSVPDASRYAVTVSGPLRKTYYVSRPTLSLTGLVNGSKYTFSVRAYVDFIGSWTQLTDLDFSTFVPGTANAPAPFAQSAGNGCVTLTWNPVPGAQKYAIAVERGNGFYTYTYDCLDTSYEVSGLTNGTTYRFLVQAYVGGTWSNYSSANLISAAPVDPHAPTDVSADAGDGEVSLSWAAVPGAERYAVAYRDGAGYRTLTYGCEGTSYVASGLSNGREYEFLVQAHCMGRWSAFTEADLVAATPWDPSSPVVRVASTGDGTVTLEWDGVDGAERYAVAERVGGRYVTFSYDCEGTSYTASDLANGYEHSFLVQAYVGGRWSSYGSGSLVTATPHGTVSPKAAAKAGYRSATISWSRVPGATRYAVAIRTSSGFKTYTYNCTSTSYTISGLQGSTKYQVLVQAYCMGRWSGYSELDLVEVTPTGPSLSYGEQLMFDKVISKNYYSATSWLILVDTSRNEVGIFSYRNSKWSLSKFWDCTTGKSSTPTVKGQFTVQSKGRSFGSGYTCWYWTQFYGDYLFHSVLYNPGSMTSIQDGRLGINASHGCVRLALSNAKWIYNNIPRGTKVVIY